MIISVKFKIINIFLPRPLKKRHEYGQEVGRNIVNKQLLLYLKP